MTDPVLDVGPGPWQQSFWVVFGGSRGLSAVAPIIFGGFWRLPGPFDRGGHHFWLFLTAPGAFRPGSRRQLRPGRSFAALRMTNPDDISVVPGAWRPSFLVVFGGSRGLSAVAVGNKRPRGSTRRPCQLATTSPFGTRHAAGRVLQQETGKFHKKQQNTP